MAANPTPAEIGRDLAIYGYVPVHGIVANGLMALRYLPTGRIEYLTYRQIRYRIDNHLLRPIAQELGIIRVPHGGILAMFDGIPHWSEESHEVQRMALEYYAHYQHDILQRQNTYAVWDWNESPEQNRAKAYAMTACLRSFRFDQRHQAVFVAEQDNTPTWHAINERTLENLGRMIDRIYTQHRHLHEGLDDSIEFFDWENWDTLGFEFLERRVVNALDHPNRVQQNNAAEPQWGRQQQPQAELVQIRQEHHNRRRAPMQTRAQERGMAARTRSHSQAGFFRFINTGPDDLSKYGIYNSVEAENYKTSCIIQTFAHVLQKNELDFLESIMQSYTIPVSYFPQIADLFNVTIWIHELGKRSRPPIVPKGRCDDKKGRKINVLLFAEHLMIYDDDIEERVENVIDYLRVMTDDEYDLAVHQWKIKHDLTARPYPACARRVWQDERNEVEFNQEKWIKSVGAKLSDDERRLGFEKFASIMKLGYRMQPQDYPSMAQMAFSLLRSKVGEKVFELRGPPADFIRECLQKPLLGAPYYPVNETGDLIQLDQNGSYSSTYAAFDGIPIGLPALIKDFDPKTIVGHYYVKINLKSFEGKHYYDPYPMIKNLGIQFWDRYWFEAVQKHYKIDYDFICGYQFKQGYVSTQWITRELWRLREEFRGKPEEAFVKRIMNMWWGRSIQQFNRFTKRKIEIKNLDSYVTKHPLIFSEKFKNGMVNVKTTRPLWASWQIPQFGVNVMSFARVRMQEAIWHLVEQGCEVYYINTDSFLIEKRFKDMIPIGTQLGEFKIEVEMTRFICLKPATKCWITNGEFHRLNGPKVEGADIKWWEDRVK
jgi:hypothetical protein